MKNRQNPFLRCGLTTALIVSSAITASADTTLSTGNNIIDTTGNPALGVITRSTGATAWFDANGTATATGTPLVNGILGSWASIGTGTGTRYTTLDGSNNVVGYTGAVAGTFGSGIPSGDQSANNYDLTDYVTIGSSNRDVNTLRHIKVAGGTQTLGNSSTSVYLRMNGLLNAGGALTIAKGGGNDTGVRIGATNQLVLQAANANITISAPISNNGGVASTGGGTASSLIVVGPNTVTLSGANNYTGGTYVNSGTLAANSGGALGSNSASVFVNSGANLNLGASLTLGGTATGGGSITNFGGTATLSGDFSSFTGTYTHNTTGSSTVVTNTASLSKNAAYNIASAQGSAQGIITNILTGNNTYELGSLSGVANSLFRNGGSVTGNTTLKIGNLNTTTEFAGSIGVGGGGTIAVEKVGSGKLTLSGTSGYTGATTVSGGTLAVNGNISTSVLTTVSAGTLQGSGSVGDLTVSGGTVAPGNSIESLGAGNVSLGNSSTFAYELDSDVLNGDLLYSSGTLNITSGAILTLTELASGTLNFNDKLTLVSYTGAWNNGLFDYLGNTLADDSVFTLGTNQWLFNYNDTVGGGNFSADQTGANRFVTLTVIPEPSAALLGGLGLLCVLRRRC